MWGLIYQQHKIVQGQVFLFYLRLFSVLENADTVYWCRGNISAHGGLFVGGSYFTKVN